MIRNLYFWLLSHLPVKDRKILFISHLGKSYGCNPKYICDYLLNHHFGEFSLHWVYDSTCTDGSDIPEGVIPVDLYSKQFQYDIKTCGILISNTRLPDWFGFNKRKGQRYIQTWHSSLRLKKIEGDANLGDRYEKMAQADSAKTSIIVSGCRFSSDIYRRAFWYSGPLLEVGTPRIDYLLQQQSGNRENLLGKAGLIYGTHYVLYAPTFRKGESLNAYDIDYSRMIATLSNKFGGQWKVLCRLHPKLLGKVSFEQIGVECIDVTNYDDIQELLIIADMLITDFSSCMFDMAFIRKPCILYASDYNQYIQNERDLYFDIDSLPFSLATTNDDLNNVIEKFDKSSYDEEVNSFLSEIGSFEKGTACEQIYYYIEKLVTLC